MKQFKVLYLLLVPLVACKSQQLTVEYSSVNLPLGDYCHRLHYDGDDTIYIFGGCSSGGDRQILKYSLEGDNISSFGSLPTSFSFGSVQSDNMGNLFLFGAGGNQVIKYELETNSASIVATLSGTIAYNPIIKACNSSPSSNIVFILGADLNYKDVFSFDLENYNVTQFAARLPIDLYGSGVSCAGGRAFVFPFTGNGNKNVWEFDFSTKLLYPLEQSDLPRLTLIPSSMSISGLIFVLTGFWPTENQKQEGLLVFDSTTNTTDFIPVGNWPVKIGKKYYYFVPQCEYVQKLDRIYCFGGSSNRWNDTESFIHDDIFYVDMSSYTTTSPPIETSTTIISTTSTSAETITTMTTTTMNPDWFSCTNKTDGFYPHPTDCSLFIGCHDEDTDQFACTLPSLFNPVTIICDLPQNVDCQTTCLGKPNGYYPHPHDCALYIICNQEMINLMRCPSRLLFDPVLLVCNYPENVNCPENNQ